LIILWTGSAGYCAETAASSKTVNQAKEQGKSTNPETRYYYDAKHGWYWYEKEPEPDKKQEPRLEVQAVEIPDYTYDQLWDMYPDQFQDLLMKSMKIAIQRPSEENVLRYLVYEDIARRKSTAFASVMQYVGQKHPELSNADVYPITASGRVALADVAAEDVDAFYEHMARRWSRRSRSTWYAAP
jgi:hypothetical protein